MITAQGRNIAIHPEAPMPPLSMHSALTQYRCIVERALRAEARQPAATSALG
jgi:hypothetical protein